MSKREQLRQKRQQAARRRQMIAIDGVAVVAVAIAGFLAYRSYQEANTPIGEIVTIEKETWPMADGKTLGSKDAKAVIQEFSDFQ